MSCRYTSDSIGKLLPTSSGRGRQGSGRGPSRGGRVARDVWSPATQRLRDSTSPSSYICIPEITFSSLPRRWRDHADGPGYGSHETHHAGGRARVVGRALMFDFDRARLRDRSCRWNLCRPRPHTHPEYIQSADASRLRFHLISVSPIWNADDGGRSRVACRWGEPGDACRSTGRSGYTSRRGTYTDLPPNPLRQPLSTCSISA